MILGGIHYQENDDSDDLEFLSDGWILDTRTDTVRQIVHPVESSPKFLTFDNQNHMLGNDILIALACDD